MANLAKILNIFILVGLLLSWIVMLAGVAKSTDVLVKSQKGEYTKADAGLVGSLGFNIGAGAFAAAGDGGGSNLNNINPNLNSNLNDINQALQDALNQAGLGRRMMSHGRELMGQAEENAGMLMSLYWWIVFFEWLIVILAIVVGLGAIPKFKGVVVSFMNIATALLCYQAYMFVTAAYAASEANATGGWVDGVKVTSAGTVAILIFNYLWLIVNASDDERLQATVAPAKN
uniref:MARVEL domain-containing protein n=1 Tax=Chlamydomonas leiostraca TaxID=1034604 RepID=A0A7S0RHQ3_9CHLO|mmetsp:Transcript_23271/g.59466  ORF Transcript_23271/g.59466 Transcript_23271/m.59466 type:complete len:231 (+) Transcript_23271:104-796(+)|eukprot:CAMPEP_0202858344 /NCGR_PEP_ID=MMETSP1391-20130828/923_1 /ASSEMBLY_ACC=CAM_ASM_000867 /TAXON_ID=1034604 /ORGANISM="Chlamydomonas leiostraca, Strain SAG 11-49" /LENGTH=230 /DNA_ID=CAMNT_0049537257 /DNA_START=104 /DNA_END=796 /DNA_ORIENTATION=-